jgi:hypothetical protein
MLLKWDLTAIQRAIKWAQKLAFLLIFLASHEEAEGILLRESIIMGEILQSLFSLLSYLQKKKKKQKKREKAMAIVGNNL